ncbi:hypothetical protein, partial [Campylobacter concisus]|uniref:hypothetical protein n=1 Tax=Campylobacter concisus TaxID=199 RepID=UPI001CA5BA5C
MASILLPIFSKLFFIIRYVSCDVCFLDSVLSSPLMPKKLISLSQLVKSRFKPLLKTEPLKEVNFSKVIYLNSAFVLKRHLSNKTSPLYEISSKSNLFLKTTVLNYANASKSTSLTS